MIFFYFKEIKITSFLGGEGGGGCSSHFNNIYVFQFLAMLVYKTTVIQGFLHSFSCLPRKKYL